MTQPGMQNIYHLHLLNNYNCLIIYILIIGHHYQSARHYNKSNVNAYRNGAYINKYAFSKERYINAQRL